MRKAIKLLGPSALAPASLHASMLKDVPIRTCVTMGIYILHESDAKLEHWA